MLFGSVCSGIEAASVAWHPLGWRAAWLAEIDPFPCAVLAHHYPEVPNLGDMTKIALPPNTMEQDMQKQCTKCGETKLLPLAASGLEADLAPKPQPAKCGLFTSWSC